MADHDLTSPLLPAEPSDGVEVMLRIEDDDGGPPEQINNQNGNHHDHTRLYCRNPFAFLGSDGFSVPESTTVDPFRNNTPSIDGVYEWVKIVVCIPIALAYGSYEALRAVYSLFFWISMDNKKREACS
ncbi:Lysophospholipid acyltransferase LPEAT2, partial [Cucurbita argyrosperma subsp. sororia]